MLLRCLCFKFCPHASEGANRETHHRGRSSVEHAPHAIRRGSPWHTLHTPSGAVLRGTRSGELMGVARPTSDRLRSQVLLFPHAQHPSPTRNIPPQASGHTTGASPRNITSPPQRATHEPNKKAETKLYAIVSATDSDKAHSLRFSNASYAPQNAPQKRTAAAKDYSLSSRAA